MLEGMEGKVALVTGAGAGLGRAEALELAGQGVRVIVNDLSADAAKDTVAEIEANGGTAQVNTDDVSSFDGAARMVHQGIDAWGSFDILVNNAGVLRDRMIFNMTEDEWDTVIRVHLKGHFCTLRHATAHWREVAKASDDGRVYGRIVNTSSEAFLNGGAGQPNYSAAKAGIVQLTLSAVHAVGRYGVTANAICPRARTAMTEGMQGFDAEVDGWSVFSPENVSPLVAYLCSPLAERVTGQVFVVYGKMITVLRGPTADERFDASVPWTPESVADALTPFYEGREPMSDGFGARIPG